ncbi:MAG: hypothetical protein ACAH24_23170 [Hyphomicrobiaceae bacterium]|jgi:hypothetical protein
MKDERARELAAAAGLTKLDEKHLAQLAQGIASARELAAKLPKDLHWGEEIALAFRLAPPEGGKR